MAHDFNIQTENVFFCFIYVYTSFFFSTNFTVYYSLMERGALALHYVSKRRYDTVMLNAHSTAGGYDGIEKSGR